MTYVFSSAEKNVTLRVGPPCHPYKRQPFRLTAHAYVRHERYERACRECGFAWTVDRRQIKSEGNMRMDRLEWSAASRIGIPD